MTATAFPFTKIIVGDLAAAERFYTTVLGLSVAARFAQGEQDDRMEETFLSVAGAPQGGSQLAILCYPNKPRPAAGEAITGFVVKNVDAVIEAALGAGGMLVKEAYDIAEHGVRVAVIGDIEGHLVELLQFPAAPGD
jgi:predicted enzyme related to lactoylglutathione lyase